MASDGELITKLGGRCEAQAAAAAHDDDDDYDDDDSVTRLSEFWKFLTTNFLTKVGQIIGNWKGYIVKHHLVCKTAEISFWATFDYVELLFYFFYGDNFRPPLPLFYSSFLLIKRASFRPGRNFEFKIKWIVIWWFSRLTHFESTKADWYHLFGLRE